MIVQDDEFTTVWSGSMADTYLCALTGYAPYLPREVATDPLPESLRWQHPTGQLVVQALHQTGPMTQTQLASACNRSSRATRQALKRLSDRGAVELQQPCLLAIAPRYGQLWRLT